MKAAWLVLWAVAGAASAGQDVMVSAAPCVAPVLPPHAVSNDAVRRVERQVRAWRACAAQSTAPGTAAQVVQFDAALATWVEQTRSYSDGQRASADTLVRIEREQHDARQALRSDTPRLVAGDKR